MILLNFSHPLTSSQKEQIESLTGQTLDKVLDLAVHFDNQLPFIPQLEALMENIPLSPAQWQNEPIPINPPSLNFITALLIAELHGRMGYFAPIVRLRPKAGSLPPQYEVAEILNLNEVRERARTHRYRNGENGA